MPASATGTTVGTAPGSEVDVDDSPGPVTVEPVEDVEVDVPHGRNRMRRPTATHHRRPPHAKADASLQSRHLRS
jgi:hypothetical protein